MNPVFRLYLSRSPRADKARTLARTAGREGSSPWRNSFELVPWGPNAPGRGRIAKRPATVLKHRVIGREGAV